MYFAILDHSDFSNHAFGSPSIPPTISYRHTITIPCPTNYTDLVVNDIYVVDDNAFFCGTMLNTAGKWEAMLGYFHLRELFTGNTTINFQTITMGSSAPPTTLYRLVAYKTGSRYDIVTFGDDLSGVESTHDFCKAKIIEVQDFLGSPYYGMADLVYNTMSGGAAQKQYIDDIILTDRTVVLIGHDWNMPISIPVNMYVSYHWGRKGSCCPIFAI